MGVGCEVRFDGGGRVGLALGLWVGRLWLLCVALGRDGMSTFAEKPYALCFVSVKKFFCVQLTCGRSMLWGEQANTTLARK